MPVRIIKQQIPLRFRCDKSFANRDFPGQVPIIRFIINFRGDFIQILQCFFRRNRIDEIIILYGHIQDRTVFRRSNIRSACININITGLPIVSYIQQNISHSGIVFNRNRF